MQVLSKTLLAVFAFAGLQLFVPLPVQAAEINYFVTDLTDTTPGEDLWRFDYAVSGRLFAQSELLDIYFDQNLYGALTNEAGPNLDWDVIILQQPDLNSPTPFDVGIFDAASLTNNPSVTGLFSVSFIYLGSGTPGAQPYEIFDAEFQVAESGFTSLATQSPVPEPSTAVLLLTGLAALGAGSFRRAKKQRLRSRVDRS